MTPSALSADRLTKIAAAKTVAELREHRANWTGPHPEFGGPMSDAEQGAYARRMAELQRAERTK